MFYNISNLHPPTVKLSDTKFICYKCKTFPFTFSKSYCALNPNSEFRHCIGWIDWANCLSSECQVLIKVIIEVWNLTKPAGWCNHDQKAPAHASNTAIIRRPKCKLKKKKNNNVNRNLNSIVFISQHSKEGIIH